jgi:hypothetical protein
LDPNIFGITASLVLFVGLTYLYPRKKGQSKMEPVTSLEYKDREDKSQTANSK